MGNTEKMNKLTKKLNEDFVTEVNHSQTDQLQKLVVTLSNEIKEINDSKKADVALGKLKEDLKDLNGGYRDAKKERQVRIEYILLALQGRGAL